MKLISKEKTITVNFHGVIFDNVPEDQGFVSADSGGEVYSYMLEPACCRNYWTNASGDPEEPTCLGIVDLEGMDWKDTLVEVEDVRVD